MFEFGHKGSGKDRKAFPTAWNLFHKSWKTAVCARFCGITYRDFGHNSAKVIFSPPSKLLHLFLTFWKNAQSSTFTCNLLAVNCFGMVELCQEVPPTSTPAKLARNAYSHWGFGVFEKVKHVLLLLSDGWIALTFFIYWGESRRGCYCLCAILRYILRQKHKFFAQMLGSIGRIVYFCIRKELSYDIYKRNIGNRQSFKGINEGC